MTLALRTERPLPDVPRTTLAEWADNARQASEVSKQLAFTPFVPASLIARDGNQVDYERTAANVLGAVLTGDEIGLSPMASLRSIDIVNGTPALRAIALGGVVQSHGHDIWLAESSETRAIYRGRRKGSAEVQESRWTMDRAKKLGLAGKANWRSQPEAMLIARATAECARLVASDALLGIPYTAEELADELVGVDETQPGPTLTEAPAKRTARRRTTQARAVARPPVAAVEAEADPEPDFDEPITAASAATDEESTPEPDLITAAQLKALHAAFGDLKMSDRGDRLAYASALIGRDIASSNELTRAEASALIDDLKRAVLAAGDERQAIEP